MSDPYETGRWLYDSGYRPRGPVGETELAEPAASSWTTLYLSDGQVQQDNNSAPTRDKEPHRGH